MGRVIVPVSRLWEFFKEYDERLDKDWLLVAEKTEDGTEVYATKGERGYPQFCVDIEKETVFSVNTISRDDAEIEYKGLLNVYINDEEETTATDEELEDIDSELFTDVEKERLETLESMTACLIEIFADTDLEQTGLFSCDVRDVAKHLGEYLYNHYGISVNYPTLDVNGGVIQYPFEEDEEE